MLLFAYVYRIAMKSSKTVIEIETSILDYRHLLYWQNKITIAAYVNVILDLSKVEMMNTIAFAQLLIMKRELINIGGNLYVRGYRDNPRLCVQSLNYVD